MPVFYPLRYPSLLACLPLHTIRHGVLSHAAHITMASATTQMGLDVKLLTTLRAIAVVGFVLMSRLKEVSFKELYTSPSLPEQHTAASPEEIETLISQFIVKALGRQGQTTITEEKGAFPQLINQPSPDLSETPAEPLLVGSLEDQQNMLEDQDNSPEDREARLQQAYLDLQADGQRISGRTLAARAHVRRTTCNQWLAMYHPETVVSTSIYRFCYSLCKPSTQNEADCL